MLVTNGPYMWLPWWKWMKIHGLICWASMLVVVLFVWEKRVVMRCKQHTRADIVYRERNRFLKSARNSKSRLRHQINSRSWKAQGVVWPPATLLQGQRRGSMLGCCWSGCWNNTFPNLVCHVYVPCQWKRKAQSWKAWWPSRINLRLVWTAFAQS